METKKESFRTLVILCWIGSFICLFTGILLKNSWFLVPFLPLIMIGFAIGVGSTHEM